VAGNKTARCTEVNQVTKMYIPMLQFCRYNKLIRGGVGVITRWAVDCVEDLEGKGKWQAEYGAATVYELLSEEFPEMIPEDRA